MNHKEAGINKKVSEAVYPADIIGDTDLRMCSLLARGAWFESLLVMWRDKTDCVKGTPARLSRLWGCTLDETESIISELKEMNAGIVTESNGIVTLMCRRLQRRAKERKDGAKRQAKHREK